MSDRNDGGKAFPEVFTDHDYDARSERHFGNTYSYGGMSLRDYFAAAALQGFCASLPIERRQEMSDGVLGGAKIAAAAYVAADAMLAERAK